MREIEARRCVECQKVFTPRRNSTSAKTCSGRCRQRLHLRRMAERLAMVMQAEPQHERQK
jgi:endogenous inhibitor of DNA gyrase (YacG/DUF329 family)